MLIRHKGRRILMRKVGEGQMELEGCFVNGRDDHDD